MLKIVIDIGGFMKALIIASLMILSLNSMAQRAPICVEGNTQYQEFCGRMKHMRATVQLLDAQRAMMNTDYDFFGALALSLKENTSRLAEIAPTVLQDHKVGLQNLNLMSQQMEIYSKVKNPELFVVSNNLRLQCLNCHSSGNPNSQTVWNDVFSMSWDKISKDCSENGRNPFICKSMNEMGSNYNHLFTAYLAQVQNYSITEAVAGQILKVLNRLKTMNFKYIGEDNRLNAEKATQEIIQLAQAKDPKAFEKARDLTNACMKCHNEVSTNDLGINKKQAIFWHK